MPADNLSEDKQKLLTIVHKLLDTDHTLDFLLQLSKADLERLVVAIRGKLDSR